jgi:hypothetical protein
MREFEFSTRMKAETFGRWFDREIGTEMTAGELRRAAVEAAEVERLG